MGPTCIKLLALLQISVECEDVCKENKAVPQLKEWPICTFGKVVVACTQSNSLPILTKDAHLLGSRYFPQELHYFAVTAFSHCVPSLCSFRTEAVTSAFEDLNWCWILYIGQWKPQHGSLEDFKWQKILSFGFWFLFCF